MSEQHRRIIISDTIRFAPGEELKPTQLFVDRSQQSDCVWKLSEKEIIEQLMPTCGVTELLVGNHYLSKEKIMAGFNVQKPFVFDRNSKPGDIDIVIFSEDRIEQAIAFQVKVIQLRSNNPDNKNDFINHSEKAIHKIKDGLYQTSMQAKNYDFYRHYFLLVIAIDAREQINNSLIFRDIDEETYSSINHIINQELTKYDNDFGVLFLSIIQNNDMNISEASKIGLQEIRNSQTKEQSSDISQKIKKCINMNNFRRI